MSTKAPGPVQFSRLPWRGSVWGPKCRHSSGDPRKAWSPLGPLWFLRWYAGSLWRVPHSLGTSQSWNRPVWTAVIPGTWVHNVHSVGNFWYVFGNPFYAKTRPFLASGKEGLGSIKEIQVSTILSSSGPLLVSSIHGVEEAHRCQETELDSAAGKAGSSLGLRQQADCYMA